MTNEQLDGLERFFDYYRGATEDASKSLVVEVRRLNKLLDESSALLERADSSWGDGGMLSREIATYRAKLTPKDSK